MSFFVVSRVSAFCALEKERSKYHGGSVRQTVVRVVVGASKSAKEIIFVISISLGYHKNSFEAMMRKYDRGQTTRLVRRLLLRLFQNHEHPANSQVGKSMVETNIRHVHG